MTGVLTVEPCGPGITHLRLDRPEKLNALNAELVTALHDALRGIESDPDCRVVLLSGAGRHFCAGADLAGHGVAPGGDGSRSPQDWTAVQEHISSLVPRFRRLRVPVVAAVQGAASGPSRSRRTCGSARPTRGSTPRSSGSGSRAATSG